MRITLIALALALMTIPAEAAKRPQQQATILSPVPVVGTVVGSTAEFVRRPPWINNVLPYVGYLACSPFELVGARCR